MVMRYATDHGFFELNSFPGSNQIVVSNHAFIEPKSRGKGYGKKASLERIALMKKLGYDCALCTVISSNGRQKHILEEHGWEYLFSFFNRETEREIEIWARDLSNE